LRGLIPLPPREPFAKAVSHVQFFVRGENDLDNLFGRVKVSLDCVVTSGYIVDDGPDCLEWAGLPDQFVSRNHNAWLRLIVARDTETLNGIAQVIRRRSGEE
jgi:hypothetical protein